MAKYLIIYEDIFLKNNHNIIYFLYVIWGWPNMSAKVRAHCRQRRIDRVIND